MTTASSGAAAAASGAAGVGAADAKTQFIQRFLPVARKVEAETGIPAEYLLSQAALESGWGRREIRGADGTPPDNLVGSKATGGW